MHLRKQFFYLFLFIFFYGYINIDDNYNVKTLCVGRKLKLKNYQVMENCLKYKLLSKIALIWGKQKCYLKVPPTRCQSQTKKNETQTDI